MSDKNIPKDYDFNKEKDWEKRWEKDDIYKFLACS